MKMSYKISLQKVLGIRKFIANVRVTGFIADAPRRQRDLTLAESLFENQQTPSFKTNLKKFLLNNLEMLLG